MELLLSLWLPILLSGIAVFMLSFVMWMLMPHHKSDWAKVPDEPALIEALKDAPAGMYMFPYCADPEQWKDPEWIEQRNANASGSLIVRPRGPWSMGSTMLQSFVFNVIVSLVTAYVATIAFGKGADGTDVFRLTATVAFLAYTGALAWDMIWAQKPGKAVFKNVLDGLLYGLATGALFMLLWPAA